MTFRPVPATARTLLLIGSYLFSMPNIAAAAQKLECPASIEQTSVRLVDTPQGWTTFVAAPLYLHAAAPMNGPPDKLGELADFTQQRNKKAWTYTYQLDGKFPDGKWLACTYGEGDQLTLAKRLDDNVKACSFTQRKGTHVGENAVAIRCD